MVPCFKADFFAELRASMPFDEALEDNRELFAALDDRTAKPATAR